MSIQYILHSITKFYQTQYVCVVEFQLWKSEDERVCLTKTFAFTIFFSVVANDEQAPSIADEDVGGMPDWAIAVVVIGLGSFAFVIVFGITVVSVGFF